MPGLQRARRRLRPGQRADPGRARRRRRRRDEWVLDGQKVWTSLAHWSDWCFVLARTDRDAPKHKGISFLLIRMDAPGIEIRPIVQITGTSEFNEVFFAGARTPADLVVGGVEQRVEGRHGPARLRAGRVDPGPAVRLRARAATRSSTWPRPTARPHDPRFRQRLADARSRIEIMRWNSLRMLTQADRPELERRGLHLQALLGPPAPRPRRAVRRRPRRRRPGRRRRRPTS